METAFQPLPYKGDKPYIFISYAHKNSNEVLAMIQKLQTYGYRVWFDEGIDPGTEWDENIAFHVKECHLFIALLSDEYLESSNCKDELNYARDCEKDRLLIYLTDVRLPAGMQMRLSRLQAIHKYRYLNQEDFWEKLLETPGIVSCLEMSGDTGKVLEGREGKSSSLSGEPGDTKPVFEPSVEQPRAEPVKTASVSSAGAKTVIPQSLNKTRPTAGNGIKDDDDIDADFADALSKALETSITPKLVTGTITEISSTEVVVDIGTAHRAFIPKDQWTLDPRVNPPAKVGDRVTAGVVKVDDAKGAIVLSRAAVEKQTAWDSIVKAEKDRSLLEGIITEVHKGGVVANVQGVRVFIPATQSGQLRDADQADLVMMLNQKVRLCIIGVDPVRRRVVGSIRAAEQEERNAKAAEIWENIKEGKVYKGVVKSLANCGAFVDIGGVDGMVHISELSWFPVKHPSEVVNVGDTVTVCVLSFNKEKRTISLSMKDPDKEPWKVFLSKYSVGDVATVRIVKLMTFGAFAEIIPGVEGFIHISQKMFDQQEEKPGDILREGQEVTVMISAIDKENKKISLFILSRLQPRS